MKLLLYIFLAKTCLAEITSSYFCADMNPQSHIFINQLMGMWYGIEILSHTEEMHYRRVDPSCPIIHITEEPQETMDNPLYRDYNYGSNYGEGHGYSTHRTQVGRNYQDPQYNREIQRPQDYDQRSKGYGRYDNVYENRQNSRYDNVYGTRYPTYTVNRREKQRYGSATGQNDYVRKLQQEIRKLRIHWDENGSSIEYNLRYNISRPGFWISEGPQNGSALEPQFRHFAGTVQVIKAVGNHLVLTICHQLPDKQLYSIILARSTKLDNVEIHGVHNLLNRKGLSTNAVKKVCNSSYKITSNLVAVLLMYLLNQFL